MNERVRSINNTPNMARGLRDTCLDQLTRVLNNEWMDKYREFIEVRREQQHLKTLNRWKEKFKTFRETTGERRQMHSIAW